MNADDVVGEHLNDSTEEQGSLKQSLLGHPIIGLVFRLVLAGVMGVAGAVKLFEPHGARDAILAYRLLPPSWAPVLGYLLPGVEVCVAVLLLVGLFVRLSAVVCTVLMAMFIFGIASVWVRGYSIDCGCFGGGGELNPAGKNVRYATEIARDTGLGLIGLWLIKWPKTKFAVE